VVAFYIPNDEERPEIPEGWVTVDRPKLLRSEASGNVWCGCTSRSDGLGDVPYEVRNSEGCRLINHNQLQSMQRPSQCSMRGTRFLHFRRICDGRQTRTTRIWIGSVITGLAIWGGVILWINMKRAVSTEGCHAVVEFMHRTGTI